MQLMVPPQLLEFRVLGPGVKRQLELHGVDVPEAGLAHHLGPRGHGVHVLAELVGRVVEVFGPSEPGLGFCAGDAVLAEAFELDGLEFEPAAGVEVGEGLGEEAREIFHHAFHLAAVDVVEFLGVGPVAFVVVDFEVDVWGDPVRR